MKKLAIILLAGFFALNVTACDTGDDDDTGGDQQTNPSAYPFSCHFLDPFNDTITHCVGYENVTTIAQATEWCNENKLGCGVVAPGTAQEGGCEGIASQSSGHCLMDDERCSVTWGTIPEARADNPSDDCDPDVKFSSAWGCEVPSNGTGVYVCMI